jgi:NADPH2:quinone reductase
MVKKRGGRVIGTVSTEEKAALAREAGADEVVLYTQESFKEAAKRANGGKGVDVVYDSVGRTTFEDGIDSLRPRGYMVLYGQASGAVPAIDPQILARKGSLFLTRPTSHNYTADRRELLSRTDDLFAWMRDGSLAVRIDRVLPLAQAAEAHRLLEGRATMGKLLLEC